MHRLGNDLRLALVLTKQSVFNILLNKKRLLFHDLQHCLSPILKLANFCFLTVLCKNSSACRFRPSSTICRTALVILFRLLSGLN